MGIQIGQVFGLRNVFNQSNQSSIRNLVRRTLFRPTERRNEPKNVSYPVAGEPISIGEGGPTPTIRSQM